LFVPRSLGWALEGTDCARQTGQFGNPAKQIISHKDGFDGKQLTVTTYI